MKTFLLKVVFNIILLYFKVFPSQYKKFLMNQKEKRLIEMATCTKQQCNGMICRMILELPKSKKEVERIIKSREKQNNRDASIYNLLTYDEWVNKGE